MKKILAYILLLIMVVQVLPQSLFEKEAKAVVVLENGLDTEDHIKEKDTKEIKVATVHTFFFTNSVNRLTTPLAYHAPLVLSPEKEVATPPPNIC